MYRQSGQLSVKLLNKTINAIFPNGFTNILNTTKNQIDRIMIKQYINNVCVKPKQRGISFR